MTLTGPEARPRRRRGKIGKLKRTLRKPKWVSFFVFVVAALLAAGLSYWFGG